MVSQNSPALRSNRRLSAVGGLIVGSLFWGFLAGCGEPEQIREYTVSETISGDDPMAMNASQAQATGRPERMLAAMVPQRGQTWFFKLSGPARLVKEQGKDFVRFIQSVHFADGQTPNWERPEHWEQEGKSGMRFATLKIPAETETLELTVIPLPTQGDDYDQYALENINRWRGQLGLRPMAQSDLKEEVVEMPLRGSNASKALLVNLLGRKTGGGQPPFAGMQPNPPAQKPNTPPAQAADNSKNSDNQSPTYEVPKEWAAAKNDTFSQGAFERQKDGQTVRITVTPLNPIGDTLPLQINRWRGQVELPPAEGDEVAQGVEDITAGDLTGQYVKLMGPETAEDRKAMLVGILTPGSRTWYFKLLGDAPLVLEEEARFKKFVQSVRFSSDEEAGDE